MSNPIKFKFKPQNKNWFDRLIYNHDCCLLLPFSRAVWGPLIFYDIRCCFFRFDRSCCCPFHCSSCNYCPGCYCNSLFFGYRRPCYNRRLCCCHHLCYRTASEGNRSFSSFIRSSFTYSSLFVLLARWLHPKNLLCCTS